MAKAKREPRPKAGAKRPRRPAVAPVAPEAPSGGPAFAEAKAAKRRPKAAKLAEPAPNGSGTEAAAAVVQAPEPAPARPRRFKELPQSERDEIWAARQRVQDTKRDAAVKKFAAKDAADAAKGALAEHDMTVQDLDNLLGRLLDPSEADDEDEPFRLESPPDPGKPPERLGAKGELGPEGKGKPGPPDDDEWRRLALTALPGLALRTRKILEDANLWTVGAVADWTMKKQLADIKGVGTAKATEIEDAFIRLWEARAKAAATPAK